MPRDHISKQFDADIKAIRSQVLQMGAFVEAQIVHAIDALATGDTDLADQVILDDHRVNSLEVSIDEKCSSIIVRRQPTAGDLQFAIMIAKTVTDLERIGDEAKKVARIAKMIYGKNTLTVPRFIEVRHMGNLVVESLRKSLQVFASPEGSRVAQSARHEIEVENEFRNVLRSLIGFMIEDPRTISVAIDLIFAARAIERMGDHAMRLAKAYQRNRTRDAMLTADEVFSDHENFPKEEHVAMAAAEGGTVLTTAG